VPVFEKCDEVVFELYVMYGYEVGWYEPK